jgi:hypothetical protein
MKGLQLIKEAIAVGILMIGFGYLGSMIAQATWKKTAPGEYFNKYHIMEASLFFAGVLAHLTLEALGVNKWYCKNGVACK